jgi:hypothetical protein
VIRALFSYDSTTVNISVLWNEIKSNYYFLKLIETVEKEEVREIFFLCFQLAIVVHVPSLFLLIPSVLVHFISYLFVLPLVTLQ